MDLVVIPKAQNQQTPADFKPIGLCNAVYKIISKTIANHLSLILPHIIDEAQSAFLKNRGVAPTTLARLEIIRQIVHAPPTIQHVRNIGIKLDLSKAFDRIEWPYVFLLFQKYEFLSSLALLVFFTTVTLLLKYPSVLIKQKPLIFILLEN